MAAAKKSTRGLSDQYNRLMELSHDLMVAAEKDNDYQLEKAATAMRVWFIENEPEFQH